MAAKTKAVWINRAQHWRRLTFLALERLEDMDPAARAAFVADHFDMTEDDGPTLDEAQTIILNLLENMGGSWTEPCARYEQQAKDAAAAFLKKLNGRAA